MAASEERTKMEALDVLIDDKKKDLYATARKEGLRKARINHNEEFADLLKKRKAADRRTVLHSTVNEDSYKSM